MLVKVKLSDAEVGGLTGTYRHGYGIDTSALLEQMRVAYKKSRRRVEVDFRELIHWVRLGDQLTHQVHPYPAKLLPHIAHFFVRCAELSKPGDVVLDPFCGSGTVALEATLAGRVAYVADANPLALLIARVKTRAYETSALRDLAAKIVARARRLRSAPEVAVVNAHLWYSPQKKRALDILARLVSDIEEDASREFFRVCFSVVARRVSNADPAISVPVRLRAKSQFVDSTSRKVAEKLAWIEAVDPIEEFLKVCHANIERIECTNRMFPARKEMIEVGVDARSLTSPGTPGLRLPAESIPLIVTSPPYGSAQKYIRASSLSLNWLELAAPSELAALEGASIGREHMPRHRGMELSDNLPKAYEGLLERIDHHNPARGQITRQYLHDMRAALKEMARVIRPGGHVVTIIGNNQVCGEPLRNDAFIKSILQAEGLSLDVALLDDIKSRGLMTKRNKTASIISRECVLVFRK